MLNKIISKIRSVLLPCLTLGTSTIFFFAIGFFFGINKKSDFILFTITILTTVGTILQISWYGLLPRLTSSSSNKFSAYIISNGFIYCVFVNFLPFFILFVDIPNIFLSGCVFSLLFQLHQYFKNVFIYLGRLKAFYIFDALGYAVCIISMLIFRGWLLDLPVSVFFMLLAFCWFITVISEIIYLTPYISYKLSLKPILICIVPTWKTRIANSGFIIKDLLTAYILNILAPVGGLTVYSYANKISTAIFQLFSQYKVNAWVSLVRDRGLKQVKLSDIKKVSFLSSIDFCFFQFLACLGVVIFILLIGIKINIQWGLLSVISSGTLYLIQSIEQPYARFVYMSRRFTEIAIADGINFVSYLIFFIYGYAYSNVYAILSGIVIAQLFSFYCYSLFCKRLFKYGS
ncbi:O23 family O-antigen flippase [Citrobacter freundii]|nr:O23 family O-antigen flippase [Citrobacter freundii]